MATNELPTCAFVRGLFGPRTPAIPIFGSTEALIKLREAVELRRLHTQKLHAIDATDVLTSATMHLKSAMEFPNSIDVADYLNTTDLEAAAADIDVGRIWSESEALFGQTDRLGLNKETTIPTLAHLRAAESHYASEADWGNLPERFHYELGVVLMTHVYAGAPTLEAQIFKNYEADATKIRTVWVFCRRRWDYNTGFSESWHGISRPLRPLEDMPEAQSQQQSQSQPINDQTPQHLMIPMSHEQPLNFSKKRKRDATTDDLIDGSFPRVSPAQRLKEQREAIDLTNTSPADILAGDPDLVRQGVLIHVAKFYTNTEIFNALNATLVALGRAPIKSPNNITKLLSLAIEAAAAKNPGATKDDLRRQLNDARRANGVGKGR